MTEIKYRPVAHDHVAFLKKARKRRGFRAAYEALAIEYAVANEMLAARARRPDPGSGCVTHGYDQERRFTP